VFTAAIAVLAAAHDGAGILNEAPELSSLLAACARGDRAASCPGTVQLPA